MIITLNASLEENQFKVNLYGKCCQFAERKQKEEEEEKGPRDKQAACLFSIGIDLI